MKKIITWILGIIVAFFLLIGLIFYLYISSSESEFKKKFTIVSGFSFPSDGEITRIEGCDPFSASDYYPCGGRFRVNRPTYYLYEEAIIKNSSIIHYKKENITGEWGLHTEFVIYFNFLEE